MTTSATVEAPAALDRLIVHQFDGARPSPGGIDTCIRGILKYGSGTERIGVVGVDTGSGPTSRRLGQWERHEINGSAYFFLPVARLDPGDQSRIIPHSLRLISGLARFRRRIPRPEWVQAHRADSAAAVARLFRSSHLHYFIHTQESGLTGSTSDSFWRRAASVHENLERGVSIRAARVAVFNPDYVNVVRGWNSVARSFPTWFDPDLLSPHVPKREKTIVWVGRAETPKDPELALRAFEELHRRDPEWQISFAGSGTLLERLRSSSAHLGQDVAILGRVEPTRVAQLMAEATVFLMTSHPGYEGFPRVLVESMASRAVPVVTDGSDTGGLVEQGVTGFITSRSPEEIAEFILSTAVVDPSTVSARVQDFSAPQIVADLYERA